MNQLHIIDIEYCIFCYGHTWIPISLNMGPVNTHGLTPLPVLYSPVNLAAIGCPQHCLLWHLISHGDSKWLKYWHMGTCCTCEGHFNICNRTVCAKKWADTITFVKQFHNNTNKMPMHSNKQHHPHLGAVSIRKTVLQGMVIPMLKIRRPNGRLIFNMEIAIRR